MEDQTKKLTSAERGALGGKARAAKLTPEALSEQGKKAADSKWNSGVLSATHSGDFKIGNKVISAAVLENRKRVLTQESFLAAIGRARKAKAGTGSTALVDGLPPFLQAEALKPFISDELRESTTPVLFRNQKGGRGFGYSAELLPMVCEVYLKLRDDVIAKAARNDIRVRMPRKYEHIINACDILMRGLARVGIVALVDEATGYQQVRDRDALEKILDQYIGRELAKWAKRFPDDFYKEMLKLKGLRYDPQSSKRPMVLAHITINTVYDRIGPGLTKELQQRRQDIFESTGKRGKLQQLLTDNVGHPALQSHLSNLIFLARTFGDGEWDRFINALDKAVPRYNQTMLLPFPEESVV